MTTYRRASVLSSADSAYLAGLVDGEGTITLTREHRSENRRVVLSISSTERVLLEFALEKTGVGRITNKRSVGATHTPSYVYRATSRQALDVLSQITPYLLSYRQARARLILKDYERLTPRNGRYTEHQQQRRDAFVAAVLATLPGGRARRRSR